MYYPPTIYGQSMPIPEDVAKHLIVAQIDCEAYAYKQKAKANINVQEYEQKQWIKAQEREFKRSLYHDVVIDSNGAAIEISNSSTPNDNQHLICNAHCLTLIRLLHGGNTDEQIFWVKGLINQKSFSVYLDSARIGTSSYVHRKLLSAGVKFYSDSVSQQKELARKLITALLSNCNETESIYDTPGWHLSPGKTFIFTDQEDLSWTTISKNIH